MTPESLKQAASATPAVPGPAGSTDLIKSINESAVQINTMTLAFAAACTYIAVSVASVTPETLLFGSTIGLPLLDVKVPLEQFFFIAPALLLLLHLHLLLQQYLLANKILRLGNQPEAEPFLLPALPVSVLRRTKDQYQWLVRRLLGLLFAAVNMLVPIFLLCFIQRQFVPYHSWTTGWHEVLVLSDLFLVWYFFVRTPNEVARLGTLTPVGLALLTIAALVVSGFLAQGPGSGWERRFGGVPMVERLIPRNIVLGESMRLPAGSPSRCSTEEASSAPRGRHLDFHGRDLRGADLTGAALAEADFRGAKLDGAVLDGADLRGAEFTPLNAPVALMDARAGSEKRAQLGELSRDSTIEVTSLRDARLRGACLQRARMLYADLRAADLDGAHLEDAELSFADLRGGNLSNASAAGADLTHIRLDMADLRGADLSGASLATASLVGVDLGKGTFKAADFTGTDLRGIHAATAVATGSDFTDATLVGADLREAKLMGTTGLTVQAVRLRGAEVGGADWCLRGMPLPYVSDLRNLRAGSYSREYWSPIEKELAGRVLVKEIVERIEERIEKPTCVVRPQEVKSLAVGRVLYDASGRASPLQDWPERRDSETEAAFLKTLAKSICDEACEDSEAGRRYLAAVLKEVAGGYTPRDPLLEAEIARNLEQRILDHLFAQVDSCPGIRRLSKAERQLVAAVAHGDPLSSTVVDGDHQR
jgi:uncharacterized protein YjbI with pentapeptide repeats